jgi:hypothetical protein
MKKIFSLILSTFVRGIEKIYHFYIAIRRMEMASAGYEGPQDK